MNRGPSATAGLVARGVAFQGTHPKHASLVPADAVEWAQRFAAATGMKLRRGESAFDRAFVALQERLVVPGLTLHYVLRKRKIEELVRSAIASGFSQLVVIGAGLDSLAVRLSRDVYSVEIDRPETQSLKRSVIGDAPQMRFIAADLSHDSLEDILRLLPAVPTVFVIEAVFLYLTANEVLRSLKAIRRAAPGAQTVFTFFSEKNFSSATFIADLWLKWKAEPVRWAIDPDELPAFLRDAGFELRQLLRDVEYHGAYRAARGEHIAVVEGR